MDADKRGFMSETRKHPLNSKGKYYVDQDCCTCSAACEVVAPNHFKYDEGFVYVFKQPETPEEEAQCKDAMMCCPVEAIYDDGK